MEAKVNLKYRQTLAAYDLGGMRVGRLGGVSFVDIFHCCKFVSVFYWPNKCAVKLQLQLMRLIK